MKKLKKNSFETAPPPYLRVWMTTPPYLKVWISHYMYVFFSQNNLSSLKGGWRLSMMYLLSLQMIPRAFAVIS